VSTCDVEDRIDSSSVGYLVDNIKAYILDDEFRRLPVGAVGELYLTGLQIAEGYLNRDDETSKAFLDNPFDDDNYPTMYRTGDLVRFLPDGSIGVIGRRDGQVKIRGNRVELSEIESVLREIDFVEDVTVQTIKNGINNELVAYVVASDEINERVLKEWISGYVRQHKPLYMVPSYVMKLDKIPLNVNGKVDKRALPEVDAEKLHTEYVAPRLESEKAIVKAFEAAFNQKHIGIYDDFIRLGGDSLTAIKVLSYLEDYNITAADILSLRTPFAIANNISDISMDLDVYTVDNGCPLNEAQLNVYLDIVANDKVDAYIIPLIMDISGKYSIEEIRDALDVMLEVHPILGMCVSDDYDVPYLVKGSKPSVCVEEHVDYEFVNEFLSKPFDLQDNLCRFMIVDNEDNHLLFASFHHIIFDAISDNVFKEDLEIVLDGGKIDVDDSFLKVAAFNKQIPDTDEFTNAKIFFDLMLNESEDANVLLDSVSSDKASIGYLNLDFDYKLFKSFLDNVGVSEYVLFTGVFAYTLSRFVGSDKVLFNITENGRGRFQNYDAIGMYVTTLPIVADCKNQNVSSFMHNMSYFVYGVMKYNYYPFRALANEYDLNSNILFQFMPDWIDLGDGNLKEMNYSRYDTFENRRDFITDFSFNVLQNGEKYSLGIAYTDKYSEGLINRFMEAYNLILSQIISADNLAEINYVSKGDLEILDEINETEANLKYDDILDAFNDNLVKYPDNPLVSFNDRSYTYAEGAFIADKIAEMLKDMEIKSDNSVAFLVERSEWYMFSVLGILSLGAVFVPLDDVLPDERLEFMVRDSSSKVVIVDDSTFKRANSLFKD
ncbi:MAG: AMP-binding protein, partial [Methanobrevibacter sp.]|nr:AMP-binding protein [Methanobrevibacter sp.]